MGIKSIYRSVKNVVSKETMIKPVDHLWAFIGAFVGIGLIGLIQTTTFGANDNVFLIGSFGASAVLIYGAPYSPFAQPRNLIGGHLVSAFIGVSIQLLLPHELWLSSALAVSLSIVAMQMTKTMHPPGGGTALIAVAGSKQVTGSGYYYILSPVLSGVLILFLVAMIVNNMPKGRRYPYKKE